MCVYNSAGPGLSCQFWPLKYPPDLQTHNLNIHPVHACTFYVRVYFILQWFYSALPFQHALLRRRGQRKRPLSPFPNAVPGRTYIPQAWFTFLVPQTNSVWVQFYSCFYAAFTQQRGIPTSIMCRHTFPFTPLLCNIEAFNFHNVQAQFPFHAINMQQRGISTSIMYRHNIPFTPLSSDKEAFHPP